MTTSIRKLKNAAPIAKMSIEGTVATASLALIASPAGIAALFIVAVYFAAAAYASYQQINAIENAKGEKGPVGDKGPQGDKFEVLQTLLDGFKEDDIKQQFKEALDLSS